MESLIAAFLSLALVQNLVLTQGIGLAAALALGGRLDTACAHALQAVLVVIPAAAIAYAVDYGLLQPAGAESLRLLMWVPLCLGLNALLQGLIARRLPGNGLDLTLPGEVFASGHLLQLFVLWHVVHHSTSVLDATLDGAALGAGYALATIALSAWHGRLASAALPSRLSLCATVVLTAAIASVAVLGFDGL